MTTVIDSNNWTTFLQDYGKRHEDRPTRLGVFENHEGDTEDLWIEDGLPLKGLAAYTTRGAIHVDIMLKEYTHPIDGVARIVDVAGDSEIEGLDISDAKGRTTILRFEDWPIRKENA